MPGDEIPTSTQFPLPQEGEAGACSASRENDLVSLPPWVTPILTATINDPTMPPPLFRSYARLYAASWRNAYRCTDALDFDAELAPLLGVRPTQARQHLRYLRFAKLLYWESDGANRYVIYFSSPPGFAKPESVVGDVFNYESIDIQQQQHKDSDKPGFRSSRENDRLGDGEDGGEASQPEIYRAAMVFLERVGVWPDVAMRIANKLVENQRRGHEYLPSLADVLGWIAYCFGDGEKNKIDQPAAVLAANLKANRRCPEKYRPQPVCSACGFEEGFCECEGEPDYHFPEGFLDFALKQRDGFSQSAEYAAFYGLRPITIWGVCRICHGFPCQCEED